MISGDGSSKMENDDSPPRGVHHHMEVGRGGGGRPSTKCRPQQMAASAGFRLFVFVLLKLVLIAEGSAWQGPSCSKKYQISQGPACPN